MRKRKSAASLRVVANKKILGDASTVQNNAFEFFPRDILCLIFSYLNPMTLFKARMVCYAIHYEDLPTLKVCSAWRDLITERDEFLFKKHVLRMREERGDLLPSDFVPKLSWKDHFLEIKLLEFMRMCDGTLIDKILEERKNF
jgi:hypothetical protein